MTTVVLSSGPSTVHVVRSRVSTVPNAVLTWCGKRGMVTSGTWAWRECRKCREAAKEAGE